MRDRRHLTTFPTSTTFCTSHALISAPPRLRSVQSSKTYQLKARMSIKSPPERARHSEWPCLFCGTYVSCSTGPAIPRDTRYHRSRSTCSGQTRHRGDGTDLRIHHRNNSSRTSPECRTPWTCSAATRDGPLSTRGSPPAPVAPRVAILRRLQGEGGKREKFGQSWIVATMKERKKESHEITHKFRKTQTASSILNNEESRRDRVPSRSL